MDGRGRQQRSRDYDNSARSSGRSDRDPEQAQKREPEQSAASSGRRGNLHYQQNDSSRGHGSNLPRNHERQQHNKQRRPRSRSNERQDGNRHIIFDQRGGGPSSNDNRSSSREDFDGGRRGHLQDHFRDGKTRQQERREKYERMGPSQEDLSKIPSYINPRNVNINKVIEQQEKRKLLWQGSKSKTTDVPAETPTEPSPSKPSSSVWQNVTFSGDNDGAVANKFKKLMGLKSGDDGKKPSVPEAEEGSPASSAQPAANLSQEDLFRNLDRQYEMARASAHTHKGVGLGFR